MDVDDKVMEIVKTIWKYLVDHPTEVLGIALAYFALVVPIRQYLLKRNIEESDKRFNNYHKLIDELVGAKGQTYVDRQLAIVFELRNYPEYYEVSKRILIGCRQSWSELGHDRLIDEINYTINFIDQKTRQ